MRPSRWDVEVAYMAACARYVQTGTPGSWRLVSATMDLLYWCSAPYFACLGA